jgi:hypothetical protein
MVLRRPSELAAQTGQVESSTRICQAQKPAVGCANESARQARPLPKRSDVGINRLFAVDIGDRRLQIVLALITLGSSVYVYFRFAYLPDSRSGCRRVNLIRQRIQNS